MHNGATAPTVPVTAVLSGTDPVRSPLAPCGSRGVRSRAGPATFETVATPKQHTERRQ